MPLAAGPRLLTIHIPKMGGSWLEGVALSVGCSSRQAHAEWTGPNPPESHEPLHRVPEHMQAGRLVLACVREPFSWLQSWYSAWRATPAPDGRLTHETMAPDWPDFDMSGPDGFKRWVHYACDDGQWTDIRGRVWLPGIPGPYDCQDRHPGAPLGDHEGQPYWHPKANIAFNGGLYPYVLRYMLQRPDTHLGAKHLGVRVVTPGDSLRVYNLLGMVGLKVENFAAPGHVNASDVRHPPYDDESRAFVRRSVKPICEEVEYALQHGLDGVFGG